MDRVRELKLSLLGIVAGGGGGDTSRVNGGVLGSPFTIG